MSGVDHGARVASERRGKGQGQDAVGRSPPDHPPPLRYMRVTLCTWHAVKSIEVVSIVHGASCRVSIRVPFRFVFCTFACPSI